MKKPGAEVTREELLAFYDGKIAKWWTPDDVVFVDAIPLGATGKMQALQTGGRLIGVTCREAGAFDPDSPHGRQPSPCVVAPVAVPRAGRYSQPTQPSHPQAADTSSITLNR
jgi:hypothetical protein